MCITAWSKVLSPAFASVRWGTKFRALNPAQQVVKIVHEELIATLGEPARLNLAGPRPRLIMLVGLQGSGKTTAAAKLARICARKANA
jgi:signal recognition particle GTPase